jgi:hypothetical protein
VFVEREGLGQKSEIEPLGLDSGCTVGKCSGGGWGEVVGWCMPCGDGGRVVHLRNARQGKGGMGQNAKPSGRGSVWGCNWDAGGVEGCCVVTGPSTAVT